jgi:hypothetical protein
MNTHGGKRENAGRKPEGEQKKEVRSVAFDAENLEALEGENRSKIVNAGLKIVRPVIQGNEDEARRELENFIKTRQ